MDRETERSMDRKKVIFENKQYTVVDVDYNGALLIGKKARMTDTTAVGVPDIKVI